MPPPPAVVYQARRSVCGFAASRPVEWSCGRGIARREGPWRSDGVVVRGVAEKCRRYFDDRGLKRKASGRNRTVFAAKDGSRRGRAAEGLPKASGSTVREIVRGAKAERAEKEMSRDREAVRTLHSTDGLGLGIAFRLARREKVGDQRRTSLAKPGRVNARATCRTVPIRADPN